MLSVLVAITALQTTVILVVVVAVIFLLYKYSTNRKAAPKAALKAAIAEAEVLGEEDELYETVEPGEKGAAQKSSARKHGKEALHKKSNPYTK